MAPTEGIPVEDLVREFSDFENEREHWLEMTDLDNIKVARYMLEFGKEELLEAHGGFLRKFLQGWIKDSVEQIGIDGNIRFCV